MMPTCFDLWASASAPGGSPHREKSQYLEDGRQRGVPPASPRASSGFGSTCVLCWDVPARCTLAFLLSDTQSVSFRYERKEFIPWQGVGELAELHPKCADKDVFKRSGSSGTLGAWEPRSGSSTPTQVITGHSLGGAISVLAMAPGLAMCLEEPALAFAQSPQVELSERGWSVKEGYTFGMPRAGDATFAVNFDHLSTPQCEESREG